MRFTLPALALLLVAVGQAVAGVPELMERAVLPTTSALPTCACTVPLRQGDQLVVGLANGEIVSFHETAGRVIPRTARLPGSGPVDDIIACRVGRAVGSPNEFALLAVRGNELFSIGFGDMSVAGRVALAAPAGRYRFSKATSSRGDEDAYAALVDRPVLFDDDSAMGVVVETRTLKPGVEPAIDDVPGLAVTPLSDRVTVVAGARVIEFGGEGGYGTQLDERLDLDDEPVRIALASAPDGERTLELRVTSADSVWVSRRVTGPGRISAVAVVADSLVAMGGTRPLTQEHDIGWVALVDHDGRIVATCDHASPVTNIARVSGFIAVQGDSRNLSIYDMSLEPLWDHDSPVTDVVLLSGNFAGGQAEGLAVVGTREYRVSEADVDAIREYLDMPAFMAGAVSTGGVYSLKRAFITFYVSNEDELRQTLVDSWHASLDASGSGDFDEAAAHVATARAAAAVLGDHDEFGRLSSQMSVYASFLGTRRSLLLASFILVALGVWVAVECSRGTTPPVACGAAAALLFGAGAWSWKLIGDTGLNPALFAGGAIAALFIVRGRIAAGLGRQASGAAIEDLIRALMEFLHGAGEGVPSDGVIDAARKSVTKVAYLAQEMVDSMDDDERYEMLLGRFRERGDDFLHTTHPRVALVLSLAKRAGFVVAEAEQMSRAADRMRTAIAAVESGASRSQPVLRQQLMAIKEGRDLLASDADRAWAIIQSNPGCSLTRSIDRILREREDELAEEGVRVQRAGGVPRERDAVALWSFELRFIFENLVTNAIRAMRGSATREFTIESATDGVTCTVRIADTGAGMDERTARGLFDATGEERDGGFGMPNSRLKLQERGGDLVLESTAPGAGATFRLTIPHWTPMTGDSDA